MVLLALAAVVSASPPAKVAVRIVRAEVVSKDRWEAAPRKRETVRLENSRSVRLRLIEFE